MHKHTFFFSVLCFYQQIVSVGDSEFAYVMGVFGAFVL